MLNSLTNNILLFCLISFNVSANTDLVSLSKSAYWLDLLHYHHVGFIPSAGSQIDGDNFFLADNGNINPHAELVATIKAFSIPTTAIGSVNDHAQCIYPARYHWLKEKIPSSVAPPIHCPEFTHWFEALAAEKIYLVFPVAYLNSPSSMYGHTLFRIKKYNNDNALLDYAVNYAANPDPDDNQLTFSYKGLTGGYPGVFSVMPYYQKVKEYSSLESRDIWEYELTLTPAEVNQLVRHIWEMRNTYMDYYFFTENCSYQLLSMIDASSERISLMDDFILRSIPADTLRALSKKELVSDILFRPSVLNKMQSMQQQVVKPQVSLAKQLVLSPELITTELEQSKKFEQAQTLELAYAYSRYLSAKEKSDLTHLDRRAIKLLSERSKIDEKEVFSAVTIPKIRDDQGHDTQRINIAYGEYKNKHYQNIEYRPTYHDVLDPSQGYLKNSTLEMFSFGLKKYQGESVELSYIDFINIRSLTPISRLTTPKSWQVKLSVERPTLAEHKLGTSLSGGYGMTLPLPLGNISLMLQGDSHVNDSLAKGYYIALGPQINYLYQGDKFNVLAEYKTAFSISGDPENIEQYQLGISHHISKNWQWRYEVQKTNIGIQRYSDAKVSLVHYF